VRVFGAGHHAAQSFSSSASDETSETQAIRVATRFWNTRVPNRKPTSRDSITISPAGSAKVRIIWLAAIRTVIRENDVASFTIAIRGPQTDKSSTKGNQRDRFVHFVGKSVAVNGPATPGERSRELTGQL